MLAQQQQPASIISSIPISHALFRASFQLLNKNSTHQPISMLADSAVC